MQGLPEENAGASGSEQSCAPHVEVVLFDYGQVLSAPPDPAAWARMQTITGLSDEQLHEAYWAFRHDYDRGALTGREYWHAVARHAGVALDSTQIDALRAADIDLWTQPNAAMIAWAGRLQRARIRTAILSNIGDAMAEGVAARLPWLAGFEQCIWSHSLFLAKPDPAIFEKTIEELNAPPSGILFIDDKQENISAAAAAGMQAICYTAQAEFERAMRERGLAWLLDLGSRLEAGHVTAVNQPPVSA